MSCKCKALPHNWFCLKCLYWVFVTLFYLTIAYTIYGIYMLSSNPMLSGPAYWETLLSFLINVFTVMLGLITVAKLIQAVAKIKHAVAPCCCGHKEEEVVVVSSLDK